MYGRVRFTRVERNCCRLRNASSALTLRPRDGRVLRDLLRLVRTRRRDITRGDGVGRPEARGGPCKARGLACAVIRTRVEMRGFQSIRALSVKCGEKAENSRVLCKEEGREHPSFVLSGGRAENARALCKEKGREHPSLPLMGSKAENARTFGVSEIKNREHSYSL